MTVGLMVSATSTTARWPRLQWPSKVTAKVSELRLIRAWPIRRPAVLRSHGASVHSLFTVPPAVSAEC